MTLGERLRELRENLGLTQTYVAKKIKISNKVLSNYENDISSPDLETFKTLCSFYKTSSDIFLGLSFKEVTPSNNNITDEEKKILAYYNRLNEENKDSAKGYLVDLYRDEQKGISKKDII